MASSATRGPSKIDEKYMLWPQGFPGRSQGCLGVPPWLQKRLQIMFYLRLPNISKNLALMSFSRSAYAKSCDGFVPQETDFKRLALVLSSASACKKLAMVSSLKTMFQKRPMAPTFLSSSATRRHNNARPPPAHTLLSAAAERSSYG